MNYEIPRESPIPGADVPGYQFQSATRTGQ